MSSRRRSSATLMTVVILVAACTKGGDAPAGDGSPESSLRPTNLEQVAALDLEEPELLALLEELAQDEPVVTMYSSGQGEISDAIVLAFRKRFPDVSVQYVNLDTSDLVQRLVTEARADRRIADVVFTSTAVIGELLKQGELTLHHGLIIPTAQARELVHPYVNVTRLEFQTFAWNVDRRPDLNGPASIDDLLRPEYAGCSMTDSPSWVSLLVQERGESSARGWFEGFLANGGVMAESTNRQTRRLVLGEIDCLFLARESEVRRLVEIDGARLQWQTPTPSTAVSHGVALASGSESPFAAALLAWWIAQPEQVAVHLRTSGGSGLHPGIALLSGLEDAVISTDRLVSGQVISLDPDEASALSATAFELIADYFTANLLGP
jgi:ABC-type Fe3+ transport system substrate-binding protein